MELEHSPIGEAYMATWFYGLIHELGHVALPPDHSFGRQGLGSDEAILGLIELTFDRFPNLGPAKEEALKRARESPTGFILGLEHLRGEDLADIFATSILFQTTRDIMREVKGDTFEFVRFAHELMIFFNIVGFIDRCRGLASMAASITPECDIICSSLLHPVAMNVRAHFVRMYLDAAGAGFLSGMDTPAQKQVAAVTAALNKIIEQLAGSIDRIDSGLVVRR